MGRSITTKYQLVMSGGGFIWTPSLWFTKAGPSLNQRADGPATDAGLSAHMEGFLASLQPGGANEHLGADHAPNRARILLNDGTGRTVAQWTAPVAVGKGAAA